LTSNFRLSISLRPDRRIRLPSLQLLARRHTFVPVFLDVQLGSFRRVVRGMMQVTLRRVRVMSGLLMVPGFVVRSGFAMVPRRVVMMFCRLAVMLCSLLGQMSSSST
jgi:hypothetical protein